MKLNDHLKAPCIKDEILAIMKYSKCTIKTRQAGKTDAGKIKQSKSTSISPLAFSLSKNGVIVW